MYWPTTEWKTVNPKEQKMDPDIISGLYEHISANNLDIDSVLIIRNGYIIDEKYLENHAIRNEMKFARNDAFIHDERRHVIYSCTKSVVSLLIGIVIEKGLIKSTEQKFFDIIPERWNDSYKKRKKNITIGHLLTMTSGIPWEQRKNDDVLKSITNTPLINNPGVEFRYSAGPALLTAAIQKVTGIKASEFARLQLFKPLGIPDEDWEWEDNPQGFSKGGTGLWITPRAMAKIGLLYLNMGEWDGTTIVSSEWIKRASTPKVCLQKASKWLDSEKYGNICNQTDLQPERAECYGYLTWISPKWYAATGMFSQRIYVIPDKNLVVVFTGHKHYESGDTIYTRILNDFIIGAIINS